ncbi:MAG: hypothetical protein OXU23_12740, partial [Candidatus Poribacteria bacterium]|nr:hypothetical protein [Candidatus Poribacteria bacterium]
HNHVSKDNKSPENILKIETRVGYSNKNGEFIPDLLSQFQPFEYHFKHNSKAKKLSFHEGPLTITNKPIRRSFLFGLTILEFIIGGIIAVLIIIVYEIVRRRLRNRAA